MSADQLFMKTPRTLKSDVSRVYPFMCLGKNDRRNKIEIHFDRKPQILISRYREQIIQRQRKQKNHSSIGISKLLNNSRIQTQRKEKGADAAPKINDLVRLGAAQRLTDDPRIKQLLQ